MRISAKLKRYIGFTLAEVLITLGIIGIVAEITIPVLVRNSQKEATVGKVKKAYSILSQATLAISSDCSGNVLNCITSATMANNDDATSRAQLTALYLPKFRLARDCTTGSTGCFSVNTYKYFNNTNYGPFSSATWLVNSQIVLSDGTSVGFDWNPNSYSIVIDINGVNNPNQFGKDVFWFFYDPTKKTALDVNIGTGPDCIAGGLGYECAARVIKEGAINYY